MKTRDLGKLWENFNTEAASSMLSAVKMISNRFDSGKDFSIIDIADPYKEMPTAASATTELNSVSGRSSIGCGYFCITDTIPAVNKLLSQEIDSIFHYDYNGDTAGLLKKIGHSIGKEQLGFYNAFVNPYMGDPSNSKEEDILDVFKSRLKLIRDNKIYLLKKIGETSEINIG